MLKMVLEKIISKLQNAFMQDRLILDPIIIANECLYSRLRSSEPGVINKMDLEKTYDHVNWDYLLHMLRRRLASILGCKVLSLPVYVFNLY
jgi:hypothetical protein